MSGILQWDQVVPLTCAAYNFLSNEHFDERPFILMLGHDLVLTLSTLIQPKLYYLGNDENIISLEALKKYV